MNNHEASYVRQFSSENVGDLQGFIIGVLTGKEDSLSEADLAVLNKVRLYQGLSPLSKSKY